MNILKGFLSSCILISYSLSLFFLSFQFVGKDVPSPSSEFSHADVKIGLTILAYRYEGLRRSDFMAVLESLHEEMSEEIGPFNKRKANIKFATWVALAGGRVRGWNRSEEDEKQRAREKREQAERMRKEAEEGGHPESLDRTIDGSPDIASGPLGADLIALSSISSSSASAQAAGADIDLLSNGPVTNSSSSSSSSSAYNPRSYGQSNEIWPLQLIDFNDTDQLAVLYNLLAKLPHISYYYLMDHIFPPVLRHQGMKLSASGQALGGDMLFARRLGFSGTPSDLLPIELGKCVYEKGSDGKMLQYLSSSEIMSCVTLEADWTVNSLLDRIAAADPPVHALIDTGALITGMSNLDVAKYLLQKGLSTMEGVVFLDSADRKMILVRTSMKIVPLDQSGIPRANRFSFYDHIHCTGMDIKQALNAQAVITLGKDMSFRDYAQGAFRMRGIGVGQTLQIYMIPEVKKLILAQLAAAKGASVTEQQAILSAEAHMLTQPVSLVDICAWLVINSMKTEKTQFHMLVEQCLENVWRKHAQKDLLAKFRIVGITPRAAIGTGFTVTEEDETKLGKAIDVFRDRVDFSIENIVPVPKVRHNKEKNGYSCSFILSGQYHRPYEQSLIGSGNQYTVDRLFFFLPATCSRKRGVLWVLLNLCGCLVCLTQNFLAKLETTVREHQADFLRTESDKHDVDTVLSWVKNATARSAPASAPSAGIDVEGEAGDQEAAKARSFNGEQVQEQEQEQGNHKIANRCYDTKNPSTH
jgi:hypothetical protein